MAERTARDCTCDPTLDYGPNSPDCPTHGAEVRQWEAWSRGEARCPYCVALPMDDFAAVCDCPRYEAEARRVSVSGEAGQRG